MSTATATRQDDFETWLEAVDAHLVGTLGLSIHDLPDVPLADWHADGISPRAAARMALTEAQ